MSLRLKDLVVAVLTQIPTVLVLAALAGLAWWGNAKDWKLQAMLMLEKPEEKKEKKEEYSGAGPMTLESPESADKAGLEVEEAKQRPMTGQVSANATLAFDQTRYAQLAARVPGTAWRVLCQSGDRVRKGDVLALVSAPEVGQARANLLAAVGQYDMKNIHFRHIQEGGSALPEHQRHEARLAVRAARLRMLTDLQALANLGLFIDPSSLEGLSDDAVARRLRRLGVEGVFPEGKEPADLPANLLPIVSPFDGLVVRREVVVGDLVGPNQPLFIVADTSRLWIDANVRQEDVERLALGQEVTFRDDSTGRTATGKLTWISSEVDPKTRTIRARAVVANPDGRLRPATFGSASVLVRNEPAVLTVPDTAIQFDGKGHMVFVRCEDSEKPNQRFCPRLVLTGNRAAGYTELLDSSALLPTQTIGLLAGSGGLLPTVGSWHVLEPLLTPLRPGDAVVTTGSYVLRSELLKTRIQSEE
jgi:multidrug efflux pump subunit AcrA (membrane-fusion protein)